MSRYPQRRGSDASSDAVDTALSTAVDGRILVFVGSDPGVQRDTILLGLGVPAVAALVAALCTRGRLPVVRRSE